MKFLHRITKKSILLSVIGLAILAFICKSILFPKSTIVCAGDSLTYGSGVGDRKNTDSYPAQLETKLGGQYKVLNFGLRNATASLSGDLPYAESDEYRKSLKAASKSQCVILMLGTNDSKTYNWDEEAYKQGLKTIIQSYQSLKNSPRIIVMRSPYCYSTDGTEVAMYDIQPSVVENELGVAVKTTAEECGVEFVDLYQITENKDDLYTDGIHFHKEGYSLFVEELLNFF